MIHVWPEVDRRRNLWLFWVFNYWWHHDYAYSRNMPYFQFAWLCIMHTREICILGNVVTMHILRICISANNLTMHIPDMCIFGAYWVLYSWSTVLQPVVITNRTAMVLYQVLQAIHQHIVLRVLQVYKYPGARNGLWTCGKSTWKVRQNRISSRSFYIKWIPSRGAWPDLPGALCTRTSY